MPCQPMLDYIYSAKHKSPPISRVLSPTVQLLATPRISEPLLSFRNLCHAGHFCGPQAFHPQRTTDHFSLLSAWRAPLKWGLVLSQEASRSGPHIFFHVFCPKYVMSSAIGSYLLFLGGIQGNSNDVYCLRGSLALPCLELRCFVRQCSFEGITVTPSGSFN